MTSYEYTKKTEVCAKPIRYPSFAYIPLVYVPGMRRRAAEAGGTFADTARSRPAHSAGRCPKTLLRPQLTRKHSTPACLAVILNKFLLSHLKPLTLY